MKKKLIRRVRILVVTLFCLFLLTAGLVYFAYQHSFQLSPALLDKFRGFASSSLNLDFKVGQASFNVGRHTLKVKNLELMVPGHQPFLKATEANFYLASGTGILDYYYSRATVERTELIDVTFDHRFEKPQPRRDGKNPLAILPFAETSVVGLKIQTENSCLTYPDFNAQLVKGLKNASLNVSTGNGPFGARAELKAMSNLENNESSFRFAWKHDNLALFTPLALVKHYYGLAIGDGKIDIELEWTGNLAERIEEPKKDLLKFFNEELEGRINLQTGNFAWAGFNGSLNFDFARLATAPWTLKLVNESKEASFALNSQWLGDKESISRFQASFAGKNLKPQPQFFKILNIDTTNFSPGSLDFNGNVFGTPENLCGSGSVDADAWSVLKTDLYQSKLRWQILEKTQELQIEGLVDAEAGKIHASATLDLLKDKKGLIEGNVLGIDLQRFQPLVDFTLEGRGSGFFKIAADLAEPASTSYEMEVDLENTGFAAFKPEKIRGRLVGVGRNWLVENPSADFADGGKIWLEGTVAPEKISAELNIQNVDLINFAVPERIVSGAASLRAGLQGSFAKPHIAGEIWGSGLGIFGRDISSVKAQVQLADNLLDLSPMVIVPEGQGMIDGYYSFSLETGETRSFKLNFQQLGLDFIRSFFPESYADPNLKGLVAGSVSFNNNRSENYWDFLIDGRGLKLYDQEIDSIYLEGSILGQQGEIRNLFVRTGGGKLILSGQVLGADKFDGSVEAEAIRLEKIAFLTRFLPGLRGQLDFQGSIEWEGPEKKGYFTLFGDKIMVNERDLGNLGAEVIVNNSGMKVAHAEFDKLGVSLEGNVDWAGLKPYQADLVLKEVDLSFLTQAHGIKTFAYGGLTVDGQCSVSGTLASLTPDMVEMQLDSIKIQKENDVIVSNQPMQLKYQNNSLEVRSLELKYRQGVLGIEGILTPGADSALMLTGRDFSLRALGRLLDLPDWGYQGSLSVNASVFGQIPDLKLRADAEIKNFEIADRKIEGLTAKLSGDTRQLNLEELKVKMPASSFQVRGRIDHRDFLEMTGVDVDLSIPKGPISDLPALFPGIFRQASGTISADLRISGQPAHPQLSGELRLDADELGVSGMRKPFKDLKFALSTSDSIINIDQLEARLGRGKLSGEGNINFRDGPGSITAKLSGEKIDFSFLNFELEKASASFRVGGNLYNPEIVGDVLVPRGKFHINTDLLKDRPGLNLFLNSLNYQINVEVPRNFWLKSSFLNAEMRGKFSVLGDLDNVHLDGGISSVQGWLIFQRRKFRIDTGEIRFGGVEDAFDPHIYIKSEGQVQNTQVYLTLQGHVSSMTPKIYSSPPMSEGDLLALLTLGRDINSAMQSDSRELFESEILEGLKNSYISALIGNTISTALNLDELFLTSLYDKTDGRPRSFIRAGKYIGQNLFIAYEGTLDESEEETFIFEYRLPKGFVVNLEFEEPEKDKRIGVRYDWKFW